MDLKKNNNPAKEAKPIVLLIDDDEKHLIMTKSFIENEYEVVTAKSCKESLMLLSSGLSPSYILLDLLMPDVDGWETYERIRAISALNSIPIAIFTSLEDPGDIERAKKMKACDYITKPCKKSVLLERIKKNIKERGEGSLFDL